MIAFMGLVFRKRYDSVIGVTDCGQQLLPLAPGFLMGAFIPEFFQGTDLIGLVTPGFFKRLVPIFPRRDKIPDTQEFQVGHDHFVDNIHCFDSFPD